MAFPSGWSRKCAITISEAQVYGSGTHTAFPVCLTVANLPSEMLDKDGAHPAQLGGGDIRFTSDAAGTTKLPCHVLKFVPHNTPASGEALIYVGVDVSATADTTIYVWYDADTAKEQPKYNVNTDSDGFKGSDYVWANYESVFTLGGAGGLRNLKHANASKNIGRYGSTLQSRQSTVATRASGNTYISFPSLVKVGDRLYCAAREATEHIVNLSGSVTVRYSDDAGKTWAEDTGLAVTDASYDLRDPKLFLEDDGTLWVFYSKTNSADTSRVVNYRKASAPYTSWGSETALTTQTKANNSGKVIQLASGRIVVPCYDINGSGNTAPFIRWSDDGTTWTTDYLTSDGAAPGVYGNDNEFSVAEDPTTAGNLVVICRRNSASNLYRYTSTDSGQTWSSSASNIAIDGTSIPDMPELLYCQDGDLLLAYSKDRNSPEFHVARSTDNGATWQSDFAALWNNSGGLAGNEPGGNTGQGGYLSIVEYHKGQFVGVYYQDNAAGTAASVYCAPFTKVEDGQLNTFTATTKDIAAKIDTGIELDDTGSWIGNSALDWFNQVHTAGAFTISGWAKFNQTSDELHCFVGSSASAQDRGFFFGYENRTAASAPNALRLFVGNGSGTSINNQSASISGDTTARRYGVFCDAAGTPTFIKDVTTYAGSSALSNYAGNAELSTRIGGVANSTDDLSSGRLDGWMEMWGFSTSNLGADYEKTRYNSEATPGTFAAAGTPADAAGSSASVSVTTADAVAAITASVSPLAAVAVTTADAVAAITASVSPVAAVAVTTDDADAAISAGAGSSCVVSVTTDDAVAAIVAGTASTAAVAVTTDDAAAAIVVSVSPRALVAVTTADADAAIVAGVPGSFNVPAARRTRAMTQAFGRPRNLQ